MLTSTQLPLGFAANITSSANNMTANFGEMIRENRDRYVDKSLFIAEALNNHNKLNILESSLPIGKSLNLSMLYHFLSAQVDGKETADLFTNLEISNSDYYRQKQGKYNVIYLDFNNLTLKDYAEMRKVLLEKLIQLIYLHRLKNNDCLEDFNQAEIDELLNLNLDTIDTKQEVIFKNGLRKIIQLIRLVNDNKPPMLLIDGCDNLIPKEADLNGPLDKSLNFLSGFFTCLKDNSDFDRAYITGHTKKTLQFLPQISSHLELENSQCTIAKYFGFNLQEVTNLLEHYNINIKDDFTLRPALFHEAIISTANQDDTVTISKPIFSPTTVFDLIKSELNVQLGNAAYQGNLAEVKKLIALGADVNTHKAGRHNQGGPHVPIIAAANYGRTDVVKYLLEKGADINAKADYDRTALLFAVSDCSGQRPEDYLETVKLLIQSGADINAIDDKGVTILMHAVQENNLPAVGVLLAAGVNVNAIDHSGRSVLHHMSFFPNDATDQIFKLLIAAGANVQAVDKKGQTVLSSVLKHIQNSQLVQLLINAGANKEDLFKDGKTELMYAILWDDIKWAKKLINENKNNIDYLAKQDQQGTTALMYAAQKKEPDWVKLILKTNNQKITECWSSALLEQQDNRGNTALFYAYHEPIFSYLIHAGADINHVTKNAETALHRAMTFNLFKAIDLLFAKKIKKETLNVKSQGSGFDDGSTALFAAVKSTNDHFSTSHRDENKKIALRLLNAGANPHITCDDLTVFDICYNKAIKQALYETQNSSPYLSKFSFLTQMSADVTDEEMVKSDFASKFVR